MLLTLVTLNYQRAAFLKNQIEALGVLARSFAGSFEHVVINVETPEYGAEEVLPDNYQLRQFTRSLPEDKILNIARARNFGAKQARSANLVFLDVDCLPEPGFLEHYATCFETQLSGVFQGHAWYLKKDVSLAKARQNRPRYTQYYRPGLDPRAPFASAVTNAYEVFSSIHFGCSQQTFWKVDGFDECYRGYGCEDTDFGQKLRAHKITLSMNKAEVFHQYHKPSGAPFESVAEVVQNANYFQSKWGWLPAKSWFETFAEAGLVDLKEGKVTLRKQEE